MRVIAGSLKGRRLKAPTWKGLRPTSDRLRETLFNILAPRMAGARLVDVFSGTGALGIEALSRGAAHVTFIEQDPRAGALIADNLARCGVTDGYTLVQDDAGRALEGLRREAPADLVLLDPPYGTDRRAVERILGAAGEIVAPGGVVVLERARRVTAPDAAGRLVRSRDVISGDSALTVYATESPLPVRD